MRLLIFINSMSGGGAERVTVNLANHWAEKGWEITIVTLASQRDDFYELNPAIKRIALELSGGSRNLFVGLMQNLRRMFAFRCVLQHIQPDVAIGMMASANVLLALSSWGLVETRTLGSERIHPPQFPLGFVWEWLRRHSYSRLDAVVAQTNESAAWLKTHTSAKRVVVIPNPVNWPIANNLPHLDLKNECRAGRYLLLAVGRLVSQKQFGLLVESFESLARHYTDWDLIIIGEGPLRLALEAQVIAAGLEKRIFLPGRAGNVGEWYECADLYVMSSCFEGFPNTLAEALVYGLPAVSFDCDTGPRDIICHEVNGLLVPPDDVVRLTESLDQLMGDAALRQRFSARAVDVRERFSMARIAGMWETLFKEII